MVENMVNSHTRANKTDAGSGLTGICRVINASLPPSPDPSRSPNHNIAMGMCLSYCRVSPHNAKMLLSQPVLIYRFLGADEDELPPSGGFWNRLFGGRRAIPGNSPSLEPRTDGDEGEADKSWHAIHYLLTGTSEGGTFPDNFILEGGRQLGDEDVGYGPARLFDPTEVFQIASVLDQHAEGSLRSRYDGRAMNSAKVYPQIWGREEEDNFDYALENFIALREFVHGVRDSQSYLMVYLT